MSNNPRELVSRLRANANEPWMTLGARPFAAESAQAIEDLLESVRDLRHGVDQIISLVHNLPRSATADRIDELAIGLLNRTDAEDRLPDDSELPTAADVRGILGAADAIS